MPERIFNLRHQKVNGDQKVPVKSCVEPFGENALASLRYEWAVSAKGLQLIQSDYMFENNLVKRRYDIRLDGEPALQTHLLNNLREDCFVIFSGVCFSCGCDSDPAAFRVNNRSRE